MLRPSFIACAVVLFAATPVDVLPCASGGGPVYRPIGKLPVKTDKRNLAQYLNDRYGANNWTKSKERTRTFRARINTIGKRRYIIGAIEARISFRPGHPCAKADILYRYSYEYDDGAAFREIQRYELMGSFSAGSVPLRRIRVNAKKVNVSGSVIFAVKCGREKTAKYIVREFPFNVYCGYVSYAKDGKLARKLQYCSDAFRIKPARRKFCRAAANRRDRYRKK